MGVFRFNLRIHGTVRPMDPMWMLDLLKSRIPQLACWKTSQPARPPKWVHWLVPFFFLRYLTLASSESQVKWSTKGDVTCFTRNPCFFFDSCQLGPAQMGCNGKIIITILLSGTFINLQWIHCCSGNGHDPNLSTSKNWEWLEVGRLWHSYGDVHTGEFLNVQVTLVLQVSW